jgi:hypothetical protein
MVRIMYLEWCTRYSDWLRAGRSGDRIPVRARDFSFFQKYRPALGPTDRRIQWVPGYFLGLKQPGREVNNRHLVPRLRMSGVIFLIPIFAFVPWIGTTLGRIIRKAQVSCAGKTQCFHTAVGGTCGFKWLITLPH